MRERRRRGQPEREQAVPWGDRSSAPFFERTADTCTAPLAPGWLSEDSGECATTPWRSAGAVLEGIVVDEALAVLFPCARHGARATGPGAIPQALGTVLRKALHPLAQCGMGPTDGGRDSVDMATSDDLTDGLRATQDAGLLRLLEHGLSR